MIEWAETIAAPLETVWPLLADPRRWPEWLATDGPYLPPDTLMPVAADGVEWLASAADGQQSTWRISRNDDQHTVECKAASTQAPFTVRFYHLLAAAPADDGHVEVVWECEFELVKLNFWQRLIMGRQVNDAILTMQMYSLMNLKELAETRINSDDAGDPDEADEVSL